MEICPKCGLPIQACVCDEIIKSSQKIKITNEKKRYGKIVTVINGFDNSVNVKDIAKSLKSELACGGTFKEGTIELQGEHTKKAKEILVKLGFDEDSID
jgi:translation initiation factor 1